MLLKNKFVQVGLLSTAVLVGSLMAIGCSSTAGESTTASTTIQPVTPAPAQTAPPANQPAASPSNLLAKQTSSADRKPPVNPSSSGQTYNPMAKVAAILGIDQQKLEDAFTQASTALGIQGPSGTNMPALPSGMARPTPTGNMSAPPSGMTRPIPTGTNLPAPPTGTAIPNPSGIQGQPPAGAGPSGMSTELLAKVAGILGIDEQKLTDAFNQVMK